MDITVFLGISIGCGLILHAIGVDVGMKLFYHPNSFLIVFGGTLGACLVHFPFTQLLKLPGRLKVIFTPKSINYRKDIQQLLSYANKLRSEGNLALEKDISKLKDHFLKHGLQLLIDNVSADEIQLIMQKNLSHIDDRHREGIKFFEQLAVYAPGFGLIGTLIGLIMMLSDLKNPDQLGPSMSTALITTFYGSMLANLVFQPLAGRLEIASHEESIQKKMFIEGIVALAHDENNYMIQEKMSMCLPEKYRDISLSKGSHAKQ